jgi:hypothetical protein
VRKLASGSTLSKLEAQKRQQAAALHTLLKKGGGTRGGTGQNRPAVVDYGQHMADYGEQRIKSIPFFSVR